MSGGFDHFDAAFGDAESRRRRLQDIQNVVGDVAGELRRPVYTPDLTAAILARVEEEKPFTTARTRRLVWISRVGMAASVAVAALGIAMLHRSAPELVNWTYQAQPVSDVVQMAESAASMRYESFRVTLSSVGSFAGGSGDLARVSHRAGAGGGVGVGTELGARGVETLAWSPRGDDVRLAPLPPSYGATYVSLASMRGAGAEGQFEGAMPAPVVISTVRLAPGLTPRPLVADAPPSAVYWGGKLSTAPAASMSVPVMFEPAELGRLRAAGMAARALAGEDVGAGIGGVGMGVGGAERRVLDSLVPLGSGVGSGEMAVPR